MGTNLQLADTLAMLRLQLKEVEPQGRPSAADAHTRLETGIAALNQLLEGGFSRGRLTAFTGQSGAGLASLLRPGIQQTLSLGERVGIIDGAGTLHAPDWLTPRGEVWVIRTEVRNEALWAAESMAESGAFALIALAPPSTKRPISPRWAARLRHAAREGDTALVILDTTPPSALTAAWGLRVTPLGLNISTGRWTVHVQRTRGGPPAAEEVSFDVQERLHPRRLPPSPVVPDRRAPPSRAPREGKTGRDQPRPGGSLTRGPDRSRGQSVGADPGDATQPG